MQTRFPLDSLEISNRCVVVCDLRAWTGMTSPAWEALRGTQDEVGRRLATLLDEAAVQRIDDFGGVCKTFLCDGEAYRDTPPRIRGTAAVYSFTPKNRVGREGIEMARAARSAGYALLIMTVQKDGNYGKVWVLSGALRYLSERPLSYYEDTNSVVDALKASPEADKITVVHVQAPGYEAYVAQLADRVVTQDQYQLEVLEQQDPSSPGA